MNEVEKLVTTALKEKNILPTLVKAIKVFGDNWRVNCYDAEGKIAHSYFVTYKRPEIVACEPKLGE